MELELEVELEVADADADADALLLALGLGLALSDTTCAETMYINKQIRDNLIILYSLCKTILSARDQFLF